MTDKIEFVLVATGNSSRPRIIHIIWEDNITNAAREGQKVAEALSKAGYHNFTLCRSAKGDLSDTVDVGTILVTDPEPVATFKARAG